MKKEDCQTCEQWKEKYYSAEQRVADERHEATRYRDLFQEAKAWRDVILMLAKRHG
jgi:hypothetical protein